MFNRRLVAFLLAIVMVLGLGTMAMAAAPNEKVQVNNMMVDASKVDLASFGLTAEEESTPVETFAATATYTDLETNANFPPIKEIVIAGFENKITSSVGIRQGVVSYTLTLPAGTKASQLRNKTVTFNLGGETSTPAGSTIYISYNGVTKTATRGGSISFTMTLTPNVSDGFDISWTADNKDGTTTYKTKSCTLAAYVPTDTADVNLTSLTIGGTPADISSSTVGGVTRYVCVAELENVTSLTGLNVVAELGSGNAEAELGGIGGVKDEDDDTLVTFSNVDLSSAKNLVITNGPSTNPTQYSRTYQVSASISGKSITVYVAFRGYLADQWFNKKTEYYDYTTKGYGDGSSITDETKRETITSAITAMLALKGKNAPSRIVGTNKRAVFEKASYIPVTLTATDHSSEKDRLPGMTVYDALDQAIKDYNSNKNGINPDSHTIAQTGAENNYISSMTFDGHKIGEFDCGSASGWMYTARTSIDDVASALPNAGLRYWPISSGMYIDWYYTAAYGEDFGYSMFG